MLLLAGVNVNQTVYHVTCAQHFNQLACAHQTRQAVFGVKTLFKACGGFGSHAVLLCGHARVGTGEASGLEYHSHGVVLNLAVQATHNACKCASLVLVCDNQHGGIQGVADIVKRYEYLTVACAAYVDCLALDLLVIKRVHGLTVLQHDVVGNVNDIVDGAHTCSAQTSAHPYGRGRDLDVLDYLCSVAIAKIGRADAYGEVVVNAVTVLCTIDVYGRNVPFKIHGSSGLACKTDHGQTVGAVGGDLKLNHGVADHFTVANILSEICFVALGQNPDAVFLNTGAVVGGQAQLCKRAHHTVGVNAAQLACLDLLALSHGCGSNCSGNDRANEYVLRAGNDLNGCVSTDLDLADPQVIGVGVVLHLKHLTDANVRNFLCEHLKALYLGAGIGHAVAVFLGVRNLVCINIIVKPIKRKIHIFALLSQNCSRKRTSFS